jgi:uncharacterized protein (TIGR00255 family)
MTGFGRAERSAHGWRCQVEIRSVNSRFLEVRFKLPAGLGQSEEAVKELVKSRCARGKLEGTINLVAEEERAHLLELNRPLARSYARLLAEAHEAIGREVTVSLRDLIEIKDLVLASGWEQDAEPVARLIAEAVDGALDGLMAMREAEGRQIATDLGERVRGLRGHLADLQPLTSEHPIEQARRLRENLARLLGALPPDDERIRQEIAILAERSDVTEELTRFAAHLNGIETMLHQGGPVGRRFEFILQELNREANTLAAKCTHPRVSALVVEIKAELEKLREQIQNVE